MQRQIAVLMLGALILALGVEELHANPDQRHSIAVVIGNQKYRSDIPAVPFARRDAKDVSRFVVETMGYRDGNVLELIDAKQSDMISIFGNAENHEGKLWSWMRPGRSDVFFYY